MDLIDNIIAEMFTECHVCHGAGRRQNFDEATGDWTGDTDCLTCDKTGYVMTWEGSKLQQAIMKGEKP